MHKDKIDETIKQIEFKFQALSKGIKKVEPWLVVYEMISPDTKKAFEKSGIVVQDDFRSIIAEHRCFDGTRAETQKILDWQFRAA